MPHTFQREAAMTKTGTSRKTTPVAPSKPKPAEVYVVHTLPDRTRLTFSSFKPAYAAFKLRVKQPTGSVALYAQRKDGWAKLYMSETYPPALSQPYINADV